MYGRYNEVLFICIYNKENKWDTVVRVKYINVVDPPFRSAKSPVSFAESQSSIYLMHPKNNSNTPQNFTSAQ